MGQRNFAAVQAHFRRAETHKHRCTPRGGSSNEFADYLEEYKHENEFDETERDEDREE